MKLSEQAREMLCGEYVLGTLRGAARDRFEAMMRRDATLARQVRDWEQRLAPLAERVPEADPPADLWERIEARTIERKSLRTETAATRFPQLWQWLTASFATLAAVLAGVLVFKQPPAPIQIAQAAHAQCYVVLTNAQRAPGLVVFDRDNMKQLVVLPVGDALAHADAPTLWLEADGQLLQLGQVHSTAQTDIALTKAQSTALMAKGARMLVTTRASAVTDANVGAGAAPQFSGEIALLPLTKT